MADKPPAVHPAPNEIADYFAGLLDSQRESGIEEHFGECKWCADEGRHLYELNSAWNGWTARSHAAALREAAMAKALAHASGADEFSHWRERLIKWVEQWAGKAEGAVRVIIESSGTIEPAKKTSRVVTKGIEHLVHHDALWQFSLDAPGLLLRAEASVTRAVALPPGGPPARIEVLDPSTLEVHVDMSSDAVSAPLVLLADTRGGNPPRVRQLAGRLGEPGLFARFDEILPGRYVVALEPRQ